MAKKHVNNAKGKTPLLKHALIDGDNSKQAELLDETQPLASHKLPQLSSEKDELADRNINETPDTAAIASDYAVEASSQSTFMAQAHTSPDNNPAGQGRESEESKDDNHGGLWWWLGGIGAAGLGAGLGLTLTQSDHSGSNERAVLTGSVSDGPVQGATIYQDVNGNGVFDASDKMLTHHGQAITTGETGNFVITDQDLVENGIADITSVKLVAHGGVDTVTGLHVSVDFTAPSGYLYLNPVTSLISAYMEANPGMTAAQAELAVETALGLPDLDYASTDLTASGTPLAAQQAAAILAVSALVIEQSQATDDAFSYFVDHLGSGGSVSAIVASVTGDTHVSAIASAQLTDTVTAIGTATGATGIESALHNNIFAGASIIGDGSPAVSETLTAHIGLGLASELEVVYHWQTSADGVNWTSLSNADATDGDATYTLTTADAGRYIRAEVTYHETGTTTDTIAHSNILQVAPLSPPVITTNNGNAVSMSYTENDTAVVATVQATDADAAATHTTITYSLSGSDAGQFDINSSTGVVTFHSPPNSEAPTDANHDNAYNFTVTASDGTLSDTIDYTVSVSDVNEFSITTPIDINGAANRVAENAATGTTVGLTASASDADSSNNTITYTLVGAADGSGSYTAGEFAIDSRTGVVTVAGEIDYETVTSRILYIKATSADGSSSTQQFTINITDVNDNAPIISTNGGYAVSMNYTENGTTEVATVQASDADATTANNSVIYSLSGADAGQFDIDSRTGVVTFRNAPDYEAPGDADHDNIYNFTVIASDGTLSDTIDYTVNVTDISTIYHNPGVGDQSYLLSAIDEPLKDIKVISSIQDNVSLDVTPDAGVAVNLDDTAILALARANMSSSVLNIQDATGSISLLTVEATGASTEAEATINAATGHTFTIGDINATASGVLAATDVSLDGAVLNGSAVALEAVNTGSSVNLNISNASGTISSLLAEATGASSAAEAAITAAVAHTFTIGDISASASDSHAAAGVTLDGAVLDGSAVTVEAEGNGARATLDINHATGAISGLTVEAAGDTTAADAAIAVTAGHNLTLGGVSVTASGDDSGVTTTLDGVTLSAPTLVTASGENSDAHLDVANNSGATSGMTVRATGDFAEATASFDRSSFSAATVQVTASGDGSQADLDSGFSSGTINALAVEASGVSSDSAAWITANGPLEINATTMAALDDTARARVNISGAVTMGDYITITASGGSSEASINADMVFTDNLAGGVTVTAAGDDSLAGLGAGNASGTISSLSVAASGDAATAAANVDATGALTLGGASVTAAGDAGNASANLDGVTFSAAALTVTATGDASQARLDAVNTSGAITGLTVAVSGDSAQASATIAAPTGSAYTLGNSAVTVSGDDSSALAYLNGVQINASSVQVTSTGHDSSAQFRADNVSGAIDTLAVTAVNVSSDAAALIAANGLLEIGATTINALNNAASAHAGITGDATLDDYSTVIASGLSSDASFSAVGGNIVFTDSQAGGVSVTASGDDSGAGFHAANVSSGTISSLSVAASGDNAYAEAGISAATGATFNLGNASVSASGVDAGSSVSLDGANFTHTVIQVSATGDGSNATLDVIHASGSVNAASALDVQASGDDALARATFTVAAGSSLTLGDHINISASGLSSDASFSAAGGSLVFTDDPAGGVSVTASGDDSGAGFHTTNVSSGTISGLTVAASGDNANAEAGISAATGVTFSLGDTGVSASGADSGANVSLDGASFNHAAIHVAATGDGSAATLDAIHASGSVSALDVEASGDDELARAAFTVAAGSSLTLGDQINISASGQFSVASFSAAGDSLVFTDNPAGGVSVTASGYASEAGFHAANISSGTISGLTVATSGDDARVVADISAATGATFSLGDTGVSASGADSGAEVSLDGASFNHVAVGVTASGAYSSASLDATHAAGAISGLAVAASGLSSEAHATIAASGALEIDAISVVASHDATSGADASAASLTLRGDATLGDHITVTASGVSADASVNAGVGGNNVFTDNPAGGISVTASGYESTAHFGAPSASGAISALAVEASGEQAEADSAIVAASGDQFTLGDTSAIASGERATATVTLEGVAFSGGTLEAVASENRAVASLDANHATGTINGLNVVAGGPIPSEMQAFDYSGYFSIYGSNGFTAGTVLTLTIDGVTLSHTITAGEAASGYASALPSLLADFNGQAESAGLQVTINTSGPHDGVWIHYGDTSNHDMATFAVNGDTNIYSDEIDPESGSGTFAAADATFHGGSIVTVGGAV